MKIKNVPYTYLIGWSKLNKWYYGVRYAKDCHPSDLFTTYFTSSKQVKVHIINHGHPDVKLIRREFDSVDDARKWETTVLRRMKVKTDSKWINSHDNISFSPMYGDCNPMRNPIHYENFIRVVQREAHRNKLKVIRSNPSTKMKTSGSNHYTKRDGWVCKIAGANNPMKDPENVKKAMANRRSYVGVDNPRTKLTEEVVLLIKQQVEWPRGMVSKLAREFGISRATINVIRSGKNWKHL